MEERFLNAGSNAGILSNLSNKIIMQMRKNGEIKSQEDIQNVYDNIEDAYDHIASIFKDSSDLATALKNFELQMSNSMQISEVADVTKKVVQATIDEKEEKSKNDESDRNGIIQEFSERTKELSSFDEFDENMQENFAEKNFCEESFKEIDEKIKQAKNGDGQSAVALEQALLIVRSSSMEKQRKPEQLEREILARMMRIAATGSMESVLVDLAKKYKFDIIDQDSQSGRRVVDLSKLEILYNDRIHMLNPKAQYKTIEDYAKLNERLGQKRKVNFDQRSDVNARSLTKTAENDGKRIELRRQINTALRSNNIGFVQAAASKYPDMVSGIILEKVQVTKRMQEKEKSPKAIGKIQGEIITLQNVVKKVNLERNKKTNEKAQKTTPTDYDER